jgi:hypothetical protein
MKRTFRFTKLENGYYLANASLRNAEGGQDTWEAFKDFCKSECGDASNLYAWHVCNGTAHVLSVRVSSLI